MSDSKKKVSIRDVASKAGLSATTVSLVMQGKGNLRDETRQSVIRVIEEIGYKRKAAAPKADTNGQFALIVDDIANPYFHALFEGLDGALEDAGHFATMLSSHDSVERQSKLLNNLWQSEIGGLVIVPASGTNRDDLRAFENRRRPMIMAVRRIGQSPFDYVGANPLVGMQIAADHLIKLGYREIGFIGGYESNHAYGERYAGFAASLMRHSIELHQEWICNGGSTRHFGQQAVAQLLSRNEAPKALIAYNDLVAIGAMDAITAAGLTPGKDIAVIGYDDIPEAALQPVPLTSVATPAEKLGHVIGQAILARKMEDSQKDPLDITYPPRLIVRASCGSLHPTENSEGDANAAII